MYSGTVYLIHNNSIFDAVMICFQDDDECVCDTEDQWGIIASQGALS